MPPACFLGRWHGKKLPTERKKSYWALQTIVLKSRRPKKPVPHKPGPIKSTFTPWPEKYVIFLNSFLTTACQSAHTIGGWYVESARCDATSDQPLVTRNSVLDVSRCQPISNLQIRDAERPTLPTPYHKTSPKSLQNAPKVKRNVRYLRWKIRWSASKFQ